MVAFRSASPEGGGTEYGTASPEGEGTEYGTASPEGGGATFFSLACSAAALGLVRPAATDLTSLRPGAYASLFLQRIDGGDIIFGLRRK